METHSRGDWARAEQVSQPVPAKKFTLPCLACVVLLDCGKFWFRGITRLKHWLPEPPFKIGTNDNDLSDTSLSKQINFHQNLCELRSQHIVSAKFRASSHKTDNILSRASKQWQYVVSWLDSLDKVKLLGHMAHWQVLAIIHTLAKRIGMLTESRAQ